MNIVGLREIKRFARLRVYETVDSSRRYDSTDSAFHIALGDFYITDSHVKRAEKRSVWLLDAGSGG